MQLQQLPGQLGGQGGGVRAGQGQALLSRGRDGRGRTRAGVRDRPVPCSVLDVQVLADHRELVHAHDLKHQAGDGSRARHGNACVRWSGV